MPAELAAPAVRALKSAGYERLSQLHGAARGDLERLHGVGPKAIRQLEAALSAAGLSLAD